MSSPPILTVGYTTYMRRESAMARVHSFLATPMAANVALLVIDDCSSDGTYEAITQNFASNRLTTFRNEVNLGQTRTICRMFEECRTDYLIVMSEEDEMDATHLGTLCEVLQTYQPGFVSPQMWTGGRMIRGRTSSGPICDNDFFSASFYVSGLVYHVAAARAAAVRIRQLATLNAAVWLYPQTALAIEVMLQRPALWMNAPLARKCDALPSLITDIGGAPYQHLESRWRQHLAWHRYFELIKDGLDAVQSQRIDVMWAATLDSLYDRIVEAMQRECPESEQAFRRGALLSEGRNQGLTQALESKLENFRGMIRRRDEKIARLEARLKLKG